MKSPERQYRYRLLILVIAGTLDCSVANSQPTAWTPHKSVEIVVGTSPGSGTDVAARRIQKLLQSEALVRTPTVVVNKPGGGSAVANAYIHEHAGDAHYLTLASYNLVTNYITGKSKLSYRDFTLIAQLFDEFISFNVRRDSRIKTGSDLVEALRRNPGSLAIGISSSAGGANHIALALAMKTAGVNIKNLKTVVFSSGGKSTVALLGGHIDVQVVAASVAVPQLNAKKIRTIAISAPKRLPGIFATVPTWREQGIDVVASNWRNIVAPEGLDKAEIAYWDQVFGTLVKTAEWQHDLTAHYWVSNYMNSAESAAYVGTRSTEIRSILMGLGLAKQ